MQRRSGDSNALAIGLADRSAENDVTPRKSDQFVVDDQNDGQISRDVSLV